VVGLGQKTWGPVSDFGALDFLDFPGLLTEGYTKTSEKTWDYNCIAWAVSKDDKWWWPLGKLPNGKDAYWPSDAPKKITIPAFVKLFARRGYALVLDNNVDLEEGFEKVAIYAVGVEPKHAARQLPSGKWAHKMGSSIDLETDTAAAVEGSAYGTLVRVMKRRLAPTGR